MIEQIPAEALPLILLFSAIFFLLRILKWKVKIVAILAIILTIAIPLLISDLFSKLSETVISIGTTNILLLSAILFFLGLIAGIKREKVRKLTDIEILGKLEFKRADLIGKLSLARAKKDKGAEKRIIKELEKVDKEIKALKEKLGRHI